MRLEFSAKTQREAYKLSNGICAICGLPFGGERPHYDHIKPAGMGGSNDLANCAVVHVRCHKRKTSEHDMPPIRKSNRQRDKARGVKRKFRKRMNGGNVERWRIG